MFRDKIHEKRGKRPQFFVVEDILVLKHFFYRILNIVVSKY